MDARLEAIAVSLGDAQQLHDVAQFLGVLEVLRGDAGDAFAGDGIGFDVLAEQEAGQQGELVGGIVSFDVTGDDGFHITVKGPVADADVLRRQVTEILREMRNRTS